MKTSIIVLGVAVAAIIASCDMNNDQIRSKLSDQIIGTYNGTLTSSLSQTTSATAEITSMNDYTVQVHCFNADVDTTFSIELYQDGNMMRVCATENDFKNQYGHNMSANHHMMGSNGTWTSWQQHMSAEHNPDDEHFGYFDINAQTFNYTFEFMTGALSGNRLSFSGKRKN